jgi:hypothetical protein
MRKIVRPSQLALAASIVFGWGSASAQQGRKGNDAQAPLVIAKQGSFMAGGTVLTGADGNTFHGDHLYAQYQIPVNPRALPLILWHGGGQFSKTWETTPDGREGYQSIFLRQGWPVYIIDQPRRGRAGRSMVGTTIPNAAPGEAIFWNVFRLGAWFPPAPRTFFPGVQFPRDEASIDQYWRQITPNTGPESQVGADLDPIDNAAVALLDKTGPAILVTHSRSGLYGWLTAIKSRKVKAIVAYEPTTQVTPAGEIPPDVPTAFPFLTALTAPKVVSQAEFDELAKIPIQIVFGDNIPTTPQGDFGTDLHRIVLVRARQFAETLRRHGGDVTFLHLPDIGVHGNTHFAFSDLNNVQIANLMSQYLHEKGLDRRGHDDD